MSQIYLNEEHLLLQKMVREFANQELKPLAQDIDKNSTFLSDNFFIESDMSFFNPSFSPYSKNKL